MDDDTVNKDKAVEMESDQKAHTQVKECKTESEGHGRKKR